MLRQLGTQISIPNYFFVEARFVNRFMNFCSLEAFESKDPTRSDLVRMLGFVDELKRFIEKKIFYETVC